MDNKEMYEKLYPLGELSKAVYERNKEKGFWDNEKNVGETLMLVVSELGEALEAHRKGVKASKDCFVKVVNAGSDEEFASAFKENVKDTFEDEIADAVIRLLDMCGGFNIDIVNHVYHKLRYNATRPRLHGKKY